MTTAGKTYRPRIAILASGGGSTAEAFIHATQDGRVNAEVGLIVCNKPRGKAGIYERIDRLNRHYGLTVEIVEISGKTHPGGKGARGQTLEESATICDLIKKGKYDHVALMGYMRILRGALIEEFGWHSGLTSKYEARLSNTHPGPLPETQDTYGLLASERVLKLKMKQSRHTFHLVAAGVDEGPILAAHPVDVLPGDTAQILFDRVQVVEKAALPYGIDKFLREQAAYFASH
ncbi:MAG TPA: formyltransferase family protein [Patescibacteria group bacterium]|nr:formyltransferase family protein [Patescibacteria group bacterium]